jgi:hypothetical protein
MHRNRSISRRRAGMCTRGCIIRVATCKLTSTSASSWAATPVLDAAGDAAESAGRGVATSPPVAVAGAAAPAPAASTATSTSAAELAPAAAAGVAGVAVRAVQPATRSACTRSGFAGYEWRVLLAPRPYACAPPARSALQRARDLAFHRTICGASVPISLGVTFRKHDARFIWSKAWKR